VTPTRCARALAALGVALLAAACARAPASIGSLPYFPGAVVVGTTSFDGPLVGFPQASWTQVELRSEAKYEQIRDFYKQKALVNPGAAFENESQKRGGRIFLRFLSDRRRTEFYTITVEERTASRDVSILLRRGLVKK
jgi:hypothetical protein